MKIYTKGAYLLLIRLEKEMILPKIFYSIIKPGFYAYAGNAFGSGGIEARCSRHVKSNKSKFWHIDWLTQNPKEIVALGFPKQTECSLVKELLKIKNTYMVFKGFGSSDCKICYSHLLRLPDFFSKRIIKAPYFDVKI